MSKRNSFRAIPSRIENFLSSEIPKIEIFIDLALGIASENTFCAWFSCCFRLKLWRVDNLTNVGWPTSESNGRKEDFSLLDYVRQMKWTRAFNIYDPISPALCNKSSVVIKFFRASRRTQSSYQLGSQAKIEHELWADSLFNQNPSPLESHKTTTTTMSGTDEVVWILLSLLLIRFRRFRFSSQSTQCWTTNSNWSSREQSQKRLRLMN